MNQEQTLVFKLPEAAIISEMAKPEQNRKALFAVFELSGNSYYRVAWHGNNPAMSRHGVLCSMRRRGYVMVF